MRHLPGALLLSLLKTDGPIRRNAFFHLLHCGICRENATRVLLKTQAARPEESGPDYTEAFASVGRHMAEADAVKGKAKTVAQRLFNELLQLPIPNWSGSIAADSRFASPALGALLLERSAALLEASPPESGEFANAALAVAGACRQAGAPVAQVHDLFARAWLAHAAVTRVLGLPDDAATGRELAAGHLPSGLGDPAHAAYCREAAETFEALGLWNEALALWERSVRLALAADQRVDCARAALRAGRLWAQGEGPQEASDLFEFARRHLEGSPRHELWAAAYLGFAASEALLGREAEARWALSLAAGHVEKISEARLRTPLRWQEGRVMVALGRYEKAFRMLCEVAENLASGRPFDALIARLEAAGALAEGGRDRRASEAVKEVVARAEELDLLDEAKRAIAWLAPLADHETALAEAIAHVARSLRQLARNSFLVFREIEL